MSEPRILSTEEILAADDLEERIVDVPEWGGSVRVRAFMKSAQQELREASRVAGVVDSDRLEMNFLIYGVAEPRFTPEHYELLRRKSARALDRVIAAINEINGFTEAAIAQAKDRFPA